MAGIGFVTVGNLAQATNFTISTDESICGMLFDYSGFFAPFDGYQQIQENFGDNQIALINNLEEAEELGLGDNDFMGGLVYYHLSQFYNYIASDTPLYLCLSNIQYNDWSVIETIQRASGGKIFQLGIWTSQQLWNSSDNSIYFTNLASNIESAVEELTGKVEEEHLGTMPLSVMLSANTYYLETQPTAPWITDMPDGTLLNAPKVSVCLMQNGTTEVHNMQTSMPNNAPIGCIGLVMAALNQAYAEENIGYVDKFNLNKNDNINNAEICFCGNYVTLGDISYYNGNIIAEKGYILPCQYKAKVAEVFFSGNPTLSDGDYNTIANNRVMHKIRRATYMALLPYLHSQNLIDTSTGNLSSSAQSIITTAIKDTVDNALINSLGQKQITSFVASVSKSSTILSDDSITIETWSIPISSNSEINEKTNYEI